MENNRIGWKYTIGFHTVASKEQPGISITANGDYPSATLKQAKKLLREAQNSLKGELKNES